MTAVTLPFTDLPDNTHHLADATSTRVTGSQRYRCSWLAVLDPGHPRHRSVVQQLLGWGAPGLDLGAPVGLVGLESQEHALMWSGPPTPLYDLAKASEQGRPAEDLTAFFGALASGIGGFAEAWPCGDPWDDIIPATTWTPTGRGVVTEFPFADGGAVVVYEMHGLPALTSSRAATGDGTRLVPIVTWHCTRCHLEDGPTRRAYASADPSDRRAACQRARSHVRRCPGVEGKDGSKGTAFWDDATAVIESVATGQPRPADVRGLHASRCQTKPVNPTDRMAGSSCAEVRAARAASALHAT